MGYIVMLSSFQRYFSLAAYMRRYSEKAIVIALGVPAVKELFNPMYYKDLPGGILKNFGRLLKFDQKLYVYPTVDRSTGTLITAKDIKVDPCKIVAMRGDSRAVYRPLTQSVTLTKR